jgi:acetyl-CoA carboxylase carboxyl transferase subunit alpha
MRTYLDFETPIRELEAKVADLRTMESGGENAVSVDDEVATLEVKAQEALKSIYSKLTPWQKTQVARHPERPHFADFVASMCESFTPLAGDRYFGEDPSIQGGLASFRGRSVMILGHEKGSDTGSRLKHNFGMARPEGYRKAVRLMTMADRFHIPVITLVDTPGAYPGIGAEERGQSEAIARSTDCCLSLSVPMVTLIIGEGGSGGAVAIATANRVLMLEHAIYSVISPEGAASILWRDSSKAIDAASGMRITAADLEDMGVIDEIVDEPVGGAHRDPAVAIKAVADAIERHLAAYDKMPAEQIRRERQQKFLAMGEDRGGDK